MKSKYITKKVRPGTDAGIESQRLYDIWAAGEKPEYLVDGLFVPQPIPIVEPLDMSVIERKLWNVDPDKENHEWRKKYFTNLPSFCLHFFADKYIHICKTSGSKSANEFIRKRMGREIQGRIRLVMERYSSLPTKTKIKKLSEEAEEYLKEDAIPSSSSVRFTGPQKPRLPFDFDSIKSRPVKEKMLAEFDVCELKEMAFQLSLTANKIFENSRSSILIEKRNADHYDENIRNTYTSLAEFSSSFGIPPPLTKEYPLSEDYECGCLKLIAEHWWLNKLKKSRNAMREHLAIAVGQVSKGAGAYVSLDCLKEFEYQRKKSREFIKEAELFCAETDETMPLEDMFYKTNGNPKIRAFEMKARARGLNDLAKSQDFVGLFITLTAPSKYHQSRKKGGFVGHWNGATPSDTQKYLNGVWSKIRAALAREKINWFGLRTAEPHHDGTPHWHIVAFIKEEDRARAEDIFIRYAVEEDREELFHNEMGPPRFDARCKIVREDPERGSVMSYIVKYISKNIDGSGVADDISDESGKKISESLSRVLAWKNRWNIRQFQFFGVAPVTTYRELRRFANMNRAKFADILVNVSRQDLEKIYTEMQEDFCGPIFPSSKLKTQELFSKTLAIYRPTIESECDNVVKAMESADAGNYQGYIEGQGGACVKRSDLNVRNAYEITPYAGLYSEAVSKIIGFTALEQTIKTRTKVWEIRKKKVQELQQEQIGSTALGSTALGSTWSSVNNCTHSIHDYDNSSLHENIRRELEKINGDCWEFGDDTLNALLKGSSVTIGDGRRVRIQPSYIDDREEKRPIQLIEEDIPSPKSGVFRFKGKLTDFRRTKTL